MLLTFCFCYNIEEILNYSNLDLENIVTPVDVNRYEELLVQANYDLDKRNYLVNGFRHGFSLCYEGKLNNTKRNAPNLKIRIGTKTELWNKVMNEVLLKRYAGPFEQVPYEYYVQSPIGLVPQGSWQENTADFSLIVSEGWGVY